MNTAIAAFASAAPRYRERHASRPRRGERGGHHRLRPISTGVPADVSIGFLNGVLGRTTGARWHHHHNLVPVARPASTVPETFRVQVAKRPTCTFGWTLRRAAWMTFQTRSGVIGIRHPT